jgi:3,4-dihydroxy 2-butanone 4-phosphate synthase/GTP cyclohydrolase II
MPTPFVTVPQAVEEFASGRMVIVVDDEDRENEGDLTIAAEFVTAETINFMAKYGRGLICLTMTEERADHMQLSPMTQANTSRFGTAFTESIEAREGVTTGISAHDRAHTIRVAIDPRSAASDLARPGHVFPLRARKGGVLVRAGQTEASVDLARLARLTPAAVICEIMNDDGTMARVPDLVEFCSRHNLKLLTVAELIRYRLQTERYIRRVAESILPTRYADFRTVLFQSELDGGEAHTAVVLGDLTTEEPVLVRVHSHCLHGDVFGSTLCDCRLVIDRSLSAIAEQGRGALVYLHRPAQDCHTTFLAFECADRDRSKNNERTLRQVGVGSQILHDLGVRKIRLLTNTPTHIPALQGFNLDIVECVPLSPAEPIHRPIRASVESPMLTAV